MSFFNSKPSQPIEIPKSQKLPINKNVRYVSLKQYTNYEYEIPMYSSSPNSIPKTKVVKKCIYSEDRFDPNIPFGKTLPNQDSFKKTFLEKYYML